ncbi:MAG TPA: transporter [Candidatus Avalokitesvara rifleensis]|uniref:transporter n=1 Tax=Candidatus Avalokitesvara rifleensis TaxID=3367620 RepID=UPI004029B986
MMRLFAVILSLLLYVMAPVDYVYGHHAVVSGLGTGRSGPITTASAVPVSVGGFFSDIRTDLIQFRRFTDSQLLGFAQEDLHVDSTDFTLTSSIGVAYGAMEHLTVGFRMPYVWQHDIREGHSHHGDVELHKEGSSAGFGDLILYGMYRFLEDKDRDIHIAGIFGVSVPTGETTKRTDLGTRFETEHQPGSGSWDPMAGLAFTKHWGGLSLSSNVLYIYTTPGAQRTVLGDSFEYNLALSYRVGKEKHVHNHSHDHGSGNKHDHSGHWHVDWDLVTELNGVWTQKQEIRGKKDDDSGGTILYFSPGVRMLVGNHVSFTAAFLYPIQQDPNGKEHEVDYRAIIGAGVGF